MLLYSSTAAIIRRRSTTLILAEAFNAVYAPPQKIFAQLMAQTVQVVWETQLSTADESALQDAMLQRLAERELGYYGKPGLPRPGAISKGAAPGMVRF